MSEIKQAIKNITTQIITLRECMNERQPQIAMNNNQHNGQMQQWRNNYQTQDLEIRCQQIPNYNDIYQNKNKGK